LPKFTPPPGTPTLPVSMAERGDEAIRLRAARVLLQADPCRIVAGACVHILARAWRWPRGQVRPPHDLVHRHRVTIAR